jgi:hypothetical protein
MFLQFKGRVGYELDIYTNTADKIIIESKKCPYLWIYGSYCRKKGNPGIKE